jgi:hypothetical protein
MWNDDGKKFNFGLLEEHIAKSTVQRIKTTISKNLPGQIEQQFSKEEIAFFVDLEHICQTIADDICIELHLVSCSQLGVKKVSSEVVFSYPEDLGDFAVNFENDSFEHETSCWAWGIDNVISDECSDSTSLIRRIVSSPDQECLTAHISFVLDVRIKGNDDVRYRANGDAKARWDTKNTEWDIVSISSKIR